MKVALKALKDSGLICHIELSNGTIIHGRVSAIFEDIIVVTDIDKYYHTNTPKSLLELSTKLTISLNEIAVIGELA